MPAHTQYQPASLDDHQEQMMQEQLLIVTNHILKTHGYGGVLDFDTNLDLAILKIVGPAPVSKPLEYDLRMTCYVGYDTGWRLPDYSGAPPCLSIQ